MSELNRKTCLCVPSGARHLQARPWDRQVPAHQRPGNLHQPGLGHPGPQRAGPVLAVEAADRLPADHQRPRPGPRRVPALVPAWWGSPRRSARRARSSPASGPARDRRPRSLPGSGLPGQRPAWAAACPGTSAWTRGPGSRQAAVGDRRLPGGQSPGEMRRHRRGHPRPRSPA